MKNILLVIVALFMQFAAKAQFSYGTIFPNFSMVDIDDNIYQLHDALDEGKTILAFVFYQNDPEAWAYHQSGQLQAFYAAHGPDGDNTARVIMLARDGDEWSLIGDEINGMPSQGNWLEGTPYPVFIEEFGIIPALKYPGLPTIIKFCPDKQVYKINLLTASGLYAQTSQCEIAEQAIDAQIVQTDMDTMANCIGQSRPLKAYISNMGTTPLTSAHIIVEKQGQVAQDYLWSGNLPSYHYDTVALSNVNTDGTTTPVHIYTKLPNGVQDQDLANDTNSYLLRPALYYDSDQITVEVQTDGYGDQIYWFIKDGNGVKIDWGGNPVVGENGYGGGGSVYYQDFTHHVHNVDLTGNGLDCVTLGVTSGDGYGTCCDYGNGYIRFKKGEEILFEFTDFGRQAYAKITNTFVATDDAPDLVNLKAYPNPTNGQINIAFSLPQAADVGIEVLNVVGQRMLALPPSRYMSGSQTVPLELLQVPNGMYWAVLRTRQGTEAVKFVIAK